jgi:hypothetical protein
VQPCLDIPVQDTIGDKGMHALCKGRLPGYFLGMVLFGSLSHILASTPLKFVENGRSAYRIVLDPQATDSDRRAAEELQKYVERVAGARLPVVEATFSAQVMPAASVQRLIGIAWRMTVSRSRPTAIA